MTDARTALNHAIRCIEETDLHGDHSMLRDALEAAYDALGRVEIVTPALVAKVGDDLAATIRAWLKQSAGVLDARKVVKEAFATALGNEND